MEWGFRNETQCLSSDTNSMALQYWSPLAGKSCFREPCVHWSTQLYKLSTKLKQDGYDNPSDQDISESPKDCVKEMTKEKDVIKQYLQFFFIWTFGSQHTHTQISLTKSMWVGQRACCRFLRPFTQMKILKSSYSEPQLSLRETIFLRA